MGLRLDVRRLAAVDMYGSAGAAWRRWLILAEFLALRAEIAGGDIMSELRYYTWAQFAVLSPLMFVVLATRARRSPPRR